MDNTLVPYVGRTSGVSSVSANGLIEKMVQVQLNQDKIDEVNARLLELIDTQLADARVRLDAAEAQIAAGRAEYEKQLKNFGNTVSDTVMAQMGTEVADAVTVVRDQAQALLNSVNQLIGVVNEPEILLLDEPLGALDLKLRKEMQLELKRLQREMNITFIYVTHDQEEALTMSDTVVVMNGGKVQQIGTPEDIYNEPKNAFVADFIGDSNIVDGVMHRDFLVSFSGVEFPCVDRGFAREESVQVVVRPEDIEVVSPVEGQLVGVVNDVIFKGVHFEMHVECEGREWLIHSTRACTPGETIGMRIGPNEIHIMSRSEG